jgi:peroxiredoxin Q/BCP
MRTTTVVILVCFMAVFAMTKSNNIKEGSIVSNLKAMSTSGKTVSLSNLKGKWIILYFYPKDNTSGCKKEALTYSRLINEFNSLNAKIYGINKDSIKSHKNFIEKYNLKIELLYDKTGEISKFFNVKTIFGMCKRDTVLINPEGKIEKIYRGVNPEGNPKEILKYLKNKANKL